MIDFETLRPSGRPNAFLVCTAEFCPVAPADRAPPVFPHPADKVRDAWAAMIADEPRVTQTAADDRALQYEYVQRTPVLRFPDDIAVRFAPLDEASSTVLIYSRSRYGYSDLGVNKKRVCDWLAKLEARLTGR